MESFEPKVLALYLTRHGSEKMKEMVSLSPVSSLVGMESSTYEFERKAIQNHPDILFIEYDPAFPGLVDLIERLTRSLPKGVVVAYASETDPEGIVKAMRVGVREFLSGNEQPDAFNEAVLRLGRQVAPDGQRPGRLLAVIGTKGGVGSSTLTLNLSWAISQRHGRRVALLDFDRSGGDLAFMLDVDPKRDLFDVSSNFERLDTAMMNSFLSEIAPGFHLLAAPKDQVAAEWITPEHLGRALDHLTMSHELVVVDTSSRLDEQTLLALDRSELIILVIEPTVVGLRSGRRILNLFDQLGYNHNKIALTVNRYDAKGALKAKDVAAALGQPVSAWLPNDPITVRSISNIGRPVLKEAPKAPWSKAVFKLTDALMRSYEESFDEVFSEKEAKEKPTMSLKSGKKGLLGGLFKPKPKALVGGEA